MFDFTNRNYSFTASFSFRLSWLTPLSCSAKLLSLLCSTYNPLGSLISFCSMFKFAMFPAYSTLLTSPSNMKIINVGEMQEMLRHSRGQTKLY